MANYDRYYDQQSSKDYYEYNLWENSHFNSGFHLQTMQGEASEPIQVLESSEDELSGGEGDKRSDKKNCVLSQKRIITRARILEDPEPYCRMYLSYNDDDWVTPAPSEHPYSHNMSQPGHPSDYDWTRSTWSKGGLQHATNQTNTHEPFATDVTPLSYPTNCTEMSSSKERKDKSTGLKENYFQKRLSKALARPITITKATSMMERMGWKGGPLGKNSDGIAEPIAPNATYIRKIGFGLEDRPENDRKRETKKREPQPKQIATHPEPQPKKKAKLSGKSNNVHKKGKLPKGMPKDKKDIVTTNSLIEILLFVQNNREIEVSFDNKLTGMERKVIHNTVQFIIHVTQELETIDFNDQYHMKLLQLIYESNHFNLVTESEGVKKQRQLTLYKEAKECTYLVTPDDLLPQDPDDNITEDVIEIDDTNMYKDTASQANVPVSDTLMAGNKCKEPDKYIQNESKSIQNEPKIIQNESKSIQNDCNSILIGSTSKQINDKSSEDSNPFLKSIERIQTTIPNEKSYTDAKTGTDKSMTIDSDVNTNITEILIEYFLEFLNDKVYTEFRFLGPFSDEQMDKINWFVKNVHTCVYDGESAECFGQILERINVEEEFYFDVKEDSNGSVVIYKCKLEDGI